MTKGIFKIALIAFFTATVLYGQVASTAPTKLNTASKNSTTRTANYIYPYSLHLELIVPSPPTRDSLQTAAEFKELHRIEETRTPAETAQAQADDHEEDIFIFRNVLGPNFSAKSLPFTAKLSINVRTDESLASSSLKTLFHRPRPFQIDSTLHPVCPLTPEPTSYPSGHSLSGYLLAFTLVQLVPEKRQEIFERADQYVHNRLVCGVHYASDTEASRRVAYAIFGALTASPRFQQDLAAARDETRQKLGLSLAAPQP